MYCASSTSRGCAPAPVLLSRAHWSFEFSIMRRLLRIELSWPLSRALSALGVDIPANNPMMATTIMISRSVKPLLRLAFICIIRFSFLCYQREPCRRRLLLTNMGVHELPSTNRSNPSEQIGCHIRRDQSPQAAPTHSLRLS